MGVPATVVEKKDTMQGSAMEGEELKYLVTGVDARATVGTIVGENWDTVFAVVVGTIRWLPALNAASKNGESARYAMETTWERIAIRIVL